MINVKSSVTVNAATFGFPPVRTREDARRRAAAMRSRGVNPSTPQKDSDGSWSVGVRYAGGVLSIKQ